MGKLEVPCNICPRGCCCQWGGCPGLGCSPGRPFIAHGVSRTTTSKVYNVCKGEKYAASWKSNPDFSVLPNNPHNQEIGRKWLKIAEGEHASVASFARFTLLLMSLGSPPELLAASQEAGIDEINHAKYAYTFANAFLGSNYGPGPLDVKGSLDDVSLKYTVRTLIEEGCIEETLSAIEAHITAHYAEDSTVKTVLVQIASDETRHAQLAWDALHWIIEKFPEILTFVQDTFKDEMKQQFKVINNGVSVESNETCAKNNCESEKDNLFRKYGITLQKDKDKAREVGMQTTIAPVYYAGIKDASLITKKIKELKFDHVVIDPNNLNEIR